MMAFAGHSLLCRLALKHTGIDATSFTSIRLISGAVALGLIMRIHGGKYDTAGCWLSALALFVYAAGFSFAYISLSTAAGALLLFGAVQATMIGYGLWTGERLLWRQTTDLLCAIRRTCEPFVTWTLYTAPVCFYLDAGSRSCLGASIPYATEISGCTICKPLPATQKANYLLSISRLKYRAEFY
ncbi:MAG: hypothetical protein ISR72_10190 [Methylobacter sp.]|nr:hypothetical protein [Methylobacter sp.]